MGLGESFREQNVFCFLNSSPKIMLNTIKVLDGVKLGIYFFPVCEWVYLFVSNKCPDVLKDFHFNQD